MGAFVTHMKLWAKNALPSQCISKSIKSCIIQRWAFLQNDSLLLTCFNFNTFLGVLALRMGSEALIVMA
ncbi:hypothetical protein XELAEV_18035459mg [Xenopus laevis]|uniref:Uncharacterized protein n=1 Tax=Xenopus laevis TaxID=8355 RepID=A0A974CFJ8_XENLA|nr:hypothetical protein XELAEV_18035459mg [Xenopus laevis]